MEKAISVRMRLPDGSEVEFSGDNELLKQTLDDLPSMVTKVREAFGSANGSGLSSLSVKQPTTQEEYDPIDKPKGVQDAIIKVVSTPWGRKKPRSWKEIDSALKHSAVHLSEGSLTGALTLLVQAGKLRRVKSGLTYAYSLPL